MNYGFQPGAFQLDVALLARDDLPADVRAAVERNLGLCELKVRAA